jgi:hypothetical protein
MSLSGTFATMPLPDLLQWLGDARKSGILTVALEFEERYMKIREGHLIALGSDDPRARDLARLLYARGLLDETKLRRAGEERERTRRPLRRVLLEGRYLAPEVLAQAIRTHAKDVVLQLFLWQDGRFMFSDAYQKQIISDAAQAAGGATGNDEFALDQPIPMRELIMDGMRRIDEWRRIAEILPSDYALVHALGRAPELQVLEALANEGEPIALGDLCLRFARPRFEVIEELYDAWRRGLLAVDAVPQQITRPANVSPTEMLVNNAGALLEEKQFDEAAALLRSALDLDPYHEIARRLLHRARAEQLEELYQEFPPYRVPSLVDRAGRDSPSLSPRERYLLARVNGDRDVGALTVMTPLGELETLRALKKFHHLGVVSFR